MKEMKGHARKGRPSQRLKTLHCLVDAAGSLSCRVKEPFRVGFLLIQRPEWLHADIRRLKRELPPRGKSGEYHATEDDSRTKAMIRALLCLNPEPRMIIVEWRKEVFPESAFLKDKLKIFADTNPLLASFAVTSSDIFGAASGTGYSVVEVIVEATKSDLVSEHRGHRQTLNEVLPVMLERQLRIKPGRPGTATMLKVSTLRKEDCPILSFVDHWLWAYARCMDRGDRAAFPEALESRTHVMTPDQFTMPQTDPENDELAS